MLYEVLIGLRHLKGRNRSHVVSLLTLISILGVLVGVWALTVVLSVLSGFGQDLRQKIIDTKPSMEIDRYTGDFVQPKRLCKKISTVKEVRECSPFITNEIMLSSSTNNAGVLLRGITNNASRVKKITKQMRSGKFKFLFQPQRIPATPQWEPISVNDLKLQPLIRRLPPEMKDALSQRKTTKRKTTASGQKTLHKKPAPPRDKATTSGQKTLHKKPAPSRMMKLPSPPIFSSPPLQKRRVHKRKIPRKYPGILLGKELAQNLGVMVGDVVRAVSPLGGTLTPMGPAPRVRKFRVAGVFKTGMYEFDTKFAFVTLRSAQKLFKMYDTVSGIELGVTDIFQTGLIKKKVRRAIGGGPYRVRDWIEMDSQLFGALQMEKYAMFVILTLIILVASFNIVSTLTMVVLEKTEEIAILKSMGATGSGIMRVFMIQGLAIGVIGTCLGLLLGWRTCLYLINHPIPMDTDVYYIASLPVQMHLTDFIAVALASLAISFLATVYPALQASRMKPVEGLQHE